MTETTNYHLKKPGDTDSTDQRPFNDNMDTIDQALANTYTKSEVNEQEGVLLDAITANKDALIELIDGGAKNKLENGDSAATGTRIVAFPVVLPPGTYMVYIGEYSSTDTDDERCQAYFFDSNGNTCSSRFIQTKAGTMYQEVTVTSTAAALNIYASDNYNHSAGDTVTCAKVMVCTKAAWDISQAYQPYRPSWQELYERVVALEQANA